jgi:hypothetical protein
MRGAAATSPDPVAASAYASIPHMVIGILPPSFHFPKKDDLGPLARLGERSEVFRPLYRILDTSDLASLRCLAYPGS